MNIRQYRIEYARRHHNWERRVRGIFYRALAASVKPAIASLQSGSVSQTPWINAYKKAYALIGKEAARFEYKNLKSENPIKAEGDAISFFDEQWRLFMERYGSEVALDIITDLDAYTRSRVEKALADSFAQGLTNSQTARLIQQYALGKEGRLRALRIARTETTTAANRAKELGADTYFKEIGETQGYKMWISRADAKVRHDHSSVNETAVHFDEPFNVGGFEGNLPGDPKLPAKERVNCRCTFVALSAAGYRRRFGNSL